MNTENTIMPTGPVVFEDGFTYTPAPLHAVWTWPSCTGCALQNHEDCSALMGDYTCISGEDNKAIIFLLVM